MSFPRTSTALRAALEASGLEPRKGHGQHFLTDPQAVEAIVRDAGVTAQDRVVEVGTGPGLLTNVLAETGAEVVTFEIDAELQAFARSLREWPSRVSFRVGDVLAGKHALSDEFRAEVAVPPSGAGRRVLVSNLPYGAATPILLGILALPEPPDPIVVMLQEEVAEKVLASAGDPEYGVPSVAVGLKAEGKILRRFGPEVFWPRPKVRSAVLRLRPRRPSPLAPEEHRPFAEFTTALFSHRRKIVASALRLAVPALDAAQGARSLAQAGIETTARAQEVEPARLLALWRAVPRSA